VKDLKGQSIRVGDKVAFAVNSFKGYLGLGTVVEVIPEREDPKNPTDVVPSKLKVLVTGSSKYVGSKYVGAKRGKVVTLGNAFRRAQEPGSNLDTVFVYERDPGRAKGR
jgi:hypothetical protein